MKSQKAREYFISIQIPESLDNELSKKLNALTLHINSFLSLEKFNNDLSQIIDWNKINSIKCMIEIDKPPESIGSILNIHAWARNTFHHSLRDGNIEKLIISFLIGYYLFLEPYADFKWNNISAETEQNLEKLMPKIAISIKIPNNASYSDKKYHDDYIRSLKTNSYKKVFDFLSVIDRRSRSYDYYFTNFMYAIVIICVKINSSYISNNIGKYDPVLMKLIFNNLEPYQAITVLNEYNDLSPLPLLIGLVHIVNPTWNNKYNDSLENDYKFIKLSANIVKEISKRIEIIDLYKFITECSNISGNKLWHSIFIAFAVQNQDYLDSYINNVDFSYDHGAENVFDVFCEFMPDETILDTFSMKLYKKHLEFVSEKRYYEDSYCGTSYLRFMMRAVYVISNKSCLQYGIMLKEISTDLERTLYSWNRNEIAMRFTKLVFWLLGFAYYINDPRLNELDLSHTIDLLKNEKYLDIFNKKLEKITINYGVFADFLENPNDHVIINLPLSSDAYTTVEFNKTNNTWKP